jgi:plastocyanin
VTHALRPALVATLLVAAAMVVSCGGGDSAGSGASGGGGGGGGGSVDVTIVAQDNTFEPATLKVPSGEVTVEVVNEGSNQHTFTSNELGFDTGTMAGGETATVTFTAPPQSTRFVCLLHEATGMTGEIVPQ